MHHRLIHIYHQQELTQLVSINNTGTNCFDGNHAQTDKHVHCGGHIEGGSVCCQGLYENKYANYNFIGMCSSRGFPTRRYPEPSDKFPSQILYAMLLQFAAIFSWITFIFKTLLFQGLYISGKCVYIPQQKALPLKDIFFNYGRHLKTEMFLMKP